MAGIFRYAAYRIGCNAFCFRFFVSFRASVSFRIYCSFPVSGNGHNVILVQIVEGQGTRAAKTLRTDTDAGRHGYNVRMDICRCLNAVRF